jgi:hypothetical protein
MELAGRMSRQERHKYVPFDFWGRTLEQGKDYYIRIMGEKYPVLGENNIDWVPTIMGIQINEWSLWNGSWNYRQKYNFMNYQGYDVQWYRAYIEMNTTAEILAGRMNSNCSDIRAANDTTEFQSFVENCNTATTGIYVQFPYAVTGSNDVWIYWGAGWGASSVNNISILNATVLNLTTADQWYGAGIGFPLDGVPQLFDCGGYNSNYRANCSVMNFSDWSSNNISAILSVKTAEIPNGFFKWTNDSLYFAGGMLSSSSWSNTIRRFNDTEDVQSVTNLLTLATTRRNTCAMPFYDGSNQVLFIGGDNNMIVSSVERYYPNNNTRTTFTGTYAIGRTACGGFTADGLEKGYVVGGWSGTARVSNIKVVYPKNQTIVDSGLSIPVAAQGISCVAWDVLGQQILTCLGGNTASGYLQNITEINVTSNIVKTTNLTLFETGYVSPAVLYDKSIYYLNPVNSAQHRITQRTEIRIPLTKFGDMEIYNIANESQGRAAIIEGIQNTLGTNVPIYTDQQIYIRYLDGSQLLSQFDEAVISGNQTWAFNYVTSGESYTNMSDLGNTVLVWENSSLTTTQITSQVYNLINTTKV